MTLRSVGISMFRPGAGGASLLSEDLDYLGRAGPDFAEVFPDQLGVLLGGGLDPVGLEPVREAMLDSGLAFTVHAPLDLNLMDLAPNVPYRAALRASIELAGSIGAEVVVCHAGQRVGPRDARYSLGRQLAAERAALREAGDLAAERGVMVAVENYYPELPIVQGRVYDYSVWPRELAEQISAVDHPAVGVCLDVGHAALAAGVFGFDLLEECADVAPLVRHVHLHDNMMNANLTGEPPVSEHPAYGLGDLHLPPGRGSIPLDELFRRVEFPNDPSCCVELSPGLRSLTAQAIQAARRIADLARFREPVPTWGG